MAKSTVNTKHVEPYLESFRSFERGLNGESASPIHAVRRDAMTHFAATGFPTTRDEEWRFTSVARIAGAAFTQADAKRAASVTADDVAAATFPGLAANRLVFIDGAFASAFSTAQAPSGGAYAGSLAAALAAGDPVAAAHVAKHASFRENAFTALNTGFLRDGAYLHVPDGAVWREPVFLLFLSTRAASPVMAHPRNLIVAGKNSQCFVVERYCSLGDSAHLTNAVTEVVVGPGAIVEHDKVQHESMNAYHIGSSHVSLGASSVYTSNAFALGGSIVRNTITAVMEGEGIECTLNGLSLGTGTQHIDNHTAIDHATPRCNSHELYKSILDGSSRGVFNGKIFVRQDAQKTDAKQTNKTLLLSDAATIDTKPQLEIFADDVKCTHGATVGYLDAESVFYLRSRGIGLDLARDILTYAFASDVTNRVKIEPVRAALDQMILERLHQGRQLEGI
jgi:Fe-S cluster assembly protein SufD